MFARKGKEVVVMISSYLSWEYSVAVVLVILWYTNLAWMWLSNRLWNYTIKVVLFNHSVSQIWNVVSTQLL